MESAGIPSAGADVGELGVLLDRQTGQLDVSNTFRRAALEIIEGCERRDAEAARRITRPWWRFWG